ncbi:MAG: stage II sporulation protein P [Candidatus Syntrophonatronum acetioxidans]|uniref:Stage II sporulation protein P n=1 Tax=Candidatus Syntrophonatronum acetioxidans TaxID=1795816 RepID=A0A424YAW4_9FIRM|nr:MAG: stage II sporulation protein P [Candidatus Syntrophonatronum acetioxidans]
MNKHSLLTITLLLMIFLFSGLFLLIKEGGEGEFLETGLRDIARDLRELDELTEEEFSRGDYYQIVDEEGKLVTTTGRRVQVGDEYITSQNRYYRVYKVEGYTAYAKLIGIKELPSTALYFGEELSERALTPAQGEENPPTRAIAIFHTHNAESFVPTDGTHSIDGEGGIHEVGRAFQEALEAKGIRAIFREDLHTPHDHAAYRRSRETVLELLEQEPDAIFDVHRDAAPPQVYATEIEGVPTTKIQFVVGRQNPQMEANKEFALDLKSISDYIHPGLIKGILLAQGNYNQDLTPVNLLLEVGAHTNSRQEAENGITFFADSVGHYFYGTEREPAGEAAPGKPPAEESEGAEEAVRQGIIRVILLAFFGGATFFLMNVGTYNDFKEKYFPRLEGYREELVLIWEKIREQAIILSKKVRECYWRIK